VIPEPATVRVRLSATPANAKLYLDDSPLESNPFSRSLPADANTHTLRAEASGYSTESKVISFAKDTDVTLTLERPNGPRTRIKPTRPTTTAPRDPTAPPPKPNCDPPYEIEESGIRRFKAECL
jgi:serine/threonine-protein kinase